MFWSTPLKHLLLKFLFLAAFAAGGSVQAVTCNVTATSVPLSTLYATGTATQVTGTISGSCTKQTGDVARPYIYIGINQGEPPAGRAMTRQNGTQTLIYEIYHRTYGSGLWTEAAGVPSTSSTAGGVVYRMANNATAQTFSFPYYFLISTPQAGKPAGIYDDLAVTVTLRESAAGGSATGATLAFTSFGTSASIQHSCYFSSTPTPLAINYTSFTPTTAAGSANFQLNCTYSTPYTLAIGPFSTGTLLGVNYALSISAPSGIGTGGGQNFTVNGSAVAGQSGSCATASCSSSQTHTVTVSF